MEINGKKIQEELLPNLKKRIETLKEKGVTPGIAIVTLGPEETWEAYVGQKIKLAKLLDLETSLINLRPKETSEVLSVVEELNQDKSIHGLIVQRPFPIYIDTKRVIQSVSKDKDIDGFREDSKFEVPVWLAVKNILTQAQQLPDGKSFKEWLLNQSILVIGKGETAGQPVTHGLVEMGINPVVMDSQTEDRNKLFENADVLIFATGKFIDVPFNTLKKNSILIGIGLHRDEEVLTGDFDQNEAKNYVSYYTPSPGGVGPLNLYYLFENLTRAAENSLDSN